MSERFQEDPELDDFLADVVDGVEYDLDEDGAAPDLAAVVALAHAIDPSRVSATAVQEVEAYAPVVALETGRRFRETRDDLDMHALVQQVRAQVDQEVARELSQPAAAVADEPAQTRRYWWVGVLVAAALVLGIGIGAVQATRLFEAANETDQSEALHSDRADEDETRSAVHREPVEVEPESKPAREPEAIAPAPAPSVEEAIEPEPIASTQRSRSKRRAKEVAPAEETLDEKLARLDGEAAAAWRAGQLQRAEALLAEIVRLDAQGKLAGVAYGDLFTLAHQRKDKAREMALWKAYLKRFPRGRFADDARAGLCRAAQGQARVECWTAYLADMPRGSYREQGLREVGRESP
jgi:hypothetical protein